MTSAGTNSSLLSLHSLPPPPPPGLSVVRLFWRVGLTRGAFLGSNSGVKSSQVEATCPGRPQADLVDG